MMLAAIALLSGEAIAQKGKRGSDTVTTPSGLKYIVTKAGKGAKSKPGNVVVTHYTGTLTNGTVFDDSRERGEPLAFTLGRHKVIKGWEEAFSLLRVGDRARLIIPPDIAYGAAERGSIPANSTLIFDVELLELKEHALADYLELLEDSLGIEAAVKIYQGLKAKGTGDYYVSEAQINGLGYSLLQKNKVREAIAIFKINVDEFPDSFNVYDSLGEAYMLNGDKDLAVANYRRSLELNAKNENAVEMLKKLEGG